MAIFCSASSFFNGAEVSFQFYGKRLINPI
jgi:hypothetical protein